jgi:hypothetical protein
MDKVEPQRWERVDRKGVWIRLTGSAKPYPSYPDHTSFTEDDAVAIQQWCDVNVCGRRMSFDMWQFRNEQELVLFLLRWA